MVDRKVRTSVLAFVCVIALASVLIWLWWLPTHRDDLAWNAACAAASGDTSSVARMDAYLDYLDAFPRGRHADAAHTKMGELRLGFVPLLADTLQRGEAVQWQGYSLDALTRLMSPPADVVLVRAALHPRLEIRQAATGMMADLQVSGWSLSGKAASVAADALCGRGEFAQFAQRGLPGYAIHLMPFLSGQQKDNVLAALLAGKNDPRVRMYAASQAPDSPAVEDALKRGDAAVAAAVYLDILMEQVGFDLEPRADHFVKKYEGVLQCALAQYGSRDMAQVYLNWGTGALQNASLRWCSRNGYEVTVRPVQGGEEARVNIPGRGLVRVTGREWHVMK